MTSEGPLAAYRALRRADRLIADPAQELAAEKLQTLHGRLKNTAPEWDEGGLLRFLNFGERRREPEPQGLYIYGDVGRGKSMLMDIFYESAPVAAKRRVHFHAFMQEVHAAVHEFRRTPRARRAGDDPIPPVAGRIAEAARLICFDEFQVTDVADALILSRLFRALFEDGVIVVATANRPPDDLYLGGINRELFLPFIALIKERLDLLHLAGPTDYRLARLNRLPVYYKPLDESAERAIEKAFENLTGGAGIETITLNVKGRLLAVRAAAGVARSSFDELCSRPLGAADYLAISAHFHTLVLADIPRLTPTRRDEARRLINLVDTLYDHRTKLICSADGAPDELYPAGEVAFDFARTASRLVEMQSKAYLAEPHRLRGAGA